MTNMKAVRVHEFKGLDSLIYEDVPIPRINEDDVLIQVHAAAVNPLDWKVCAGTHPLAERMELPLTPGWDVSGVIEAVGSQVTGFNPGDVVFARPDHFRQGAYAEYIAVRETEVAFKPKSLSHVEAASLPLVALTTWQSIISAAQLTSGQRILIHGASGGIGSFAVQLAKWKGAYVIGTGSARNEPFLQKLGVDEFIDYSTTRFEDAVKDVDVVYDTVGGETQQRSWQVLKTGGFLVSIVRPAPDQAVAARHNVGSELIVMVPDSEQLAQIGRLVDQGYIKPIINTVFPLAEARKAHELSKTGHVRGKIVLNVRQD